MAPDLNLNIPYFVISTSIGCVQCSFIYSKEVLDIHIRVRFTDMEYIYGIYVFIYICVCMCVITGAEYMYLCAF